MGTDTISMLWGQTRYLATADTAGQIKSDALWESLRSRLGNKTDIYSRRGALQFSGALTLAQPLMGELRQDWVKHHGCCRDARRSTTVFLSISIEPARSRQIS